MLRWDFRIKSVCRIFYGKIKNKRKSSKDRGELYKKWSCAMCIHFIFHIQNHSLSSLSQNTWCHFLCCFERVSTVFKNGNHLVWLMRDAIFEHWLHLLYTPIVYNRSGKMRNPICNVVIFFCFHKLRLGNSFARNLNLTFT